MIKFFRKIRQNLLSEGRIGKYIKYAIGEIILVVVGILIALQVNNWNESYKEQKLVIQYQERLIKDIESDLDAVKMRINYFENVKNYAEKSLDFFNKYKGKGKLLNIHSDTLNKAVVAFMLASNKWNYIPGRHTYDDLTSTGKIHLLGDIQDRKIVVDYYRELDQKRTYWEVPLEYQIKIRSLIHNDLQEIILASCESFTGSPIMSGSIQSNCNVDLDERLVNSSIVMILNEESVFQSLTYLISHYRTALTLYKEHQTSAKYIIQKFKNES